MHYISRRLEFFYKKGKLLFLIMLAGGKKRPVAERFQSDSRAFPSPRQLVYYWHQRARSNDSGNSSPI
jgi:hypothetical protein